MEATAKEFLQLYYKEVGFVLPSQIVTKFLAYLEEKQIPFQGTADERNEFEFLFAQSKGKEWFLKLMRKEKQNLIQQKIITKQQRNDRVNQLVKFENLDFFTDDEILFHILDFASIQDLLLLRTSSNFFLQFIEQKWDHLKLKFSFPIFIMVEDFNQSQCYCTSKHMIKSMCLLSGVNKPLLSQFVLQFASVSKRKPAEKVMEETQLFLHHKSVLGNSWYGVIQQVHRRNNVITKSPLQRSDLSNDILIHFSKNRGITIQNISANRLYALHVQTDVIFSSIDEYLFHVFQRYNWNEKYLYKELIIIGAVEDLQTLTCSSSLTEFVSRMYVFTHDTLYIMDQKNVLKIQKQHSVKDDKDNLLLTQIIHMLQQKESLPKQYWQELKQCSVKLEPVCKYLF